MESALKALLSQHSIFSWRISGERDNLAVILRLRERQDIQLSERYSGVHADTVSYKRKSPCQIYRDRRRADEFRQRRDNIESATMTEKREAADSEKTFGHELNTETQFENENKKSDGGGEHTSGDSVTDTEHAARGKEETEAVACGENGSHGSDMETDTNSDTETTESETEREPSTKGVARDLVKDATSMQTMLGCLKQEDRNNTFEKVMIDCRGGGPPKVMCVSQDLIATWEFGTEKTNFQLRPEDYYLPFWYHWPEISQDGAHKDTIEKLRTEMKAILNRIREMI